MSKGIVYVPNTPRIVPYSAMSPISPTPALNGPAPRIPFPILVPMSITFVTDSGIAIPSLSVLNVFGGTDIQTTASGNTITINWTGSVNPISWSVVTSVSPPNPIQIANMNGYICNGGSLVTFLLPLAPNIGDTFTIISNTARFQITENGGQSMRIGNNITTAGIGTVTSNSAGDTLEMIYVGGNLFIAQSPQGTLTTS